MSDLIYVGLVVAGAMTLVIEAYRNFNAPNARHPFELHPILKDVEVRNLCTTGEIVAGFAFYAALYLIAYSVVLSSAEVYGLLSQANSALGEIGATDGGSSITEADINKVLQLSSGDYNKPIIVSALIISSLSIGAVKPIETTMRSLAHRLAGVPRGIYRVIEHLRDANYAVLMAEHPKPLVESFEEHAGDKMPEWREQIVDSLTAIDCLLVATDSKNRLLYFPLYNLERLRGLSEKIANDIADLQDSIEKLSNEDPSTLHVKYAELAGKAIMCRSNIMAFFAVLYIRNDHAVFSSRSQRARKGDPIAGLKEEIEAAEKDEQNSFGLSILTAFVLAFLVTFALYYKWHYWQGIDTPAIFQPAAYAQNVNADVLTSCQKAFSTECDPIVYAWRSTQIRTILATVTWDQLQTLLLTVFSVLFVILGREVRIEQQSWRSNWKFTQFPFLKLLSMSLLSGVAAVFLTALVQLARLWWDANFELTQSQIIILFQDNGRFFALQAISGIILAMAALVLMDKHSERPGRSTMIIAAVAGAIYLLYQWALVFLSYGFTPGPSQAYFSWTFRDALIFSILPVSFLLIFAFLLEVGEDKAEGDTSKDQS